MFDLSEYNELERRLIAFEKALAPKRLRSMNHKRAKAYYRWVIGKVRRRGLGFKKLTKATKQIQQKDHPPMFNSGDLFKNMKVKDEGDFYSCGFYKNDSSGPEQSNISWFMIALVHTTGYRISVAPESEQGKKVRGYLASHGIHLKASTRYLWVEPRPVIAKSFIRYKKTDIDFDITEKQLNTILDKVW